MQSPKEELGSPEAWDTGVMSYSTWLLGNKLWSSVRIVCDLNPWTTPSPQYIYWETQTRRAI